MSDENEKERRKLAPKGYDPRELAAKKRQRYATTGEWVYRKQDVLDALERSRPYVRINGEPVVELETGKPYRGYNPQFDEFGNLTSYETAPKPKSFDIENINEESFANQEVYRLPSELTEIPTSSTNAARPRTLAAGWRAYQETQNLPGAQRLGTLTLMFRDGTLYNYYDVPYTLWSTFKGSLSKGPYVNRKNRNQGSDGVLLSYPRGPANISDVPVEVIDDIMTLARGAQLRFASTNRGRGGYLAPDRRRKKPGAPVARPYVPKNVVKKAGLKPFRLNGQNPSQNRGRNPNSGRGRAR